MADISFGVFVLTLLVVMSAFSVWSAWLHWIDSDRAPAMASPRASDPAVIAGHERGVVALAGWMVVMTLSILLATLTPAAAVGAGLFGASFVLLLMHFSIAWFNRPKFLVPPHRRGETGSIIEWWCHRRDLRIALREAAQRDDAPGQRADPR
jgi:hypothetical protein